MSSSTIMFLVLLLVYIINLSSSYQGQDADEIDPAMEFFDYNEKMQNRRTSIVYLDVTEQPPRIVYVSRKLKKRKKPKKKNHKTRLQRTKNNDRENEKQKENEPKHFKAKRGKKRRRGKNMKVKKNIQKEQAQMKTWEGIVYKGKSQNNNEPPKLTKSFEGNPEIRKPVDIIVHIKMKE